MTQEEKARAYDEALEKARKYHAAAKSINDIAATRYEDIFPVLCESEDKKAKKIIESIFSEAGYRYIQKSERAIVLAYLEKQG